MSKGSEQSMQFLDSLSCDLLQVFFRVYFKPTCRHLLRGCVCTAQPANKGRQEQQ